MQNRARPNKNLEKITKVGGRTINAPGVGANAVHGCAPCDILHTCTRNSCASVWPLTFSVIWSYRRCSTRPGLLRLCLPKSRKLFGNSWERAAFVRAPLYKRASTGTAVLGPAAPTTWTARPPSLALRPCPAAAASPAAVPSMESARSNLSSGCFPHFLSKARRPPPP